MTKSEIYEFIEQMESFGDIWTAEQVADVYGDKTLDDALSTRKAEQQLFGNIIDTIVNR